MSTLFVDFHFLRSKVIFHPAFPAAQTIPVPFFPPQASPCAWNPRRRCTGRSPLFSPGCRFWCIPVWMPGEQGHLPHSWHWGNLSGALIADFNVTLPPIEEQMNICKTVAMRLLHIDSIIKQKETIVDKLTAYKKSLIYEVVTGKKEV